MPSWEGFILQEHLLILSKSLNLFRNFLPDPDSRLDEAQRNPLNWQIDYLHYLVDLILEANLYCDIDILRNDYIKAIASELTFINWLLGLPEVIGDRERYMIDDLLDLRACITHTCALQHNLLLASWDIQAMSQHILYAQHLTLQSIQIVFEFPPRHRPPCRTMPWTILPALVVLWGVCWMFYPTQNPTSSATPFDGGWEDSTHIDWNVLLPDYEIDLNSVSFYQDIAGFVESPLVEVPLDDPSWPAMSAASRPFYKTPSLLEDQDNHQLMQDQEFATILGSNNLVEVPSIASLVPEKGRRGGVEPVVDSIPSPTVKSTITAATGQGGIPMANASNTKPARFTCEICGKTVGREAELKRHHQTKHEEPKFPCPVLGCKHQKPFSREDNLNQHIANMHNSTTQKCSKTVKSIEEHQTNSSSSSKGKRRLSEHDTSSNDHVVEQLRFELQQERLKSQQLEREVELLKAEKETLRVEKDTYANCFQLLANGGQNKTT